MIDNPRLFVSVIVPVYKDWHKAEQCIEALSRQSYPRDRYEIIVVDNDEDSQGHQPLHGCILINEPKPGSYAARNAALQVAKGDIFAFTDADCVPDKHWLENAVRCLASRRVDRIAGHVEIFFQQSRYSLANIYEKAFAFDQKGYAADGYSVTANLIAYRHVFDEVGHFNQAMMSGGDFEWNGRATAQGFSLSYCESCVVHHPARASMDEIKRKALRVAGGEIYRLPRLWFLRGFMPPIGPARYLAGKKNLTTLEKVVAFLLAYYIKFYKFKAIVLLKSGLSKPARL
ncbi:glycosyltransferase [Halomonas sp. McH1-25]|uniref:glycosyltransferase n=1 Tax=unclassified Halomonas TaxID=2609666 RepID=UPI001EF671CC|nr:MULTISPECIES: glycosyltransferase [unclassified Halomonas]MCG7601020.1 glycosyltransferase [Halomonas sp. McH1-25]MCP1342111.1 glycosyltransferase [Halomonas sp. FL8]MCP1360600.1 glycosyltransferase [Halomonas sp. BBD45]